jgi:neutral ceramidase
MNIDALRRVTIILAKTFSALTLAAFVSALPVRGAETGWKAGASSIVITPEQPMYLEGYVPAKIASEKVHDVYAKALALQDPAGNRVVIVTADLIGYDYGFTAGIAEEVKKKFGLSRDAILFNASHTHSGPAIYPAEWQLIYGYTPEEVAKVTTYIGWARERFVKVIGDALSGMQPAVVSFSSAQPVPFAMSRRFPTETGISYRSTPATQYPGGARDDTVPVLKVAAPDGKVRAVLFGYACHPITMSFDKFCGDYPGFAQQYIEEAYPGAVAMFVQGCGGELVPNARYQIEYAMGHGRALFEAVKSALEGAQTPVTGPLASTYTETTLNLQPAPDRKTLEEQAKSDNAAIKNKAAHLLKTLDKDGKIGTTIQCPLQAIRFGKELLLVGISGETVVEYAQTIKSENLTQFTWVAGYCNYVYAYLPTWRIIREGGYEGGEAIRYTPYSGPFLEDVESRVLTGAREVVKKVSGR